MRNLIDVSMSLRAGMTGWPGDPEFCCEPVESIQRGDPASVSRLSMSSHAGTHVDAPAHLLSGGLAVDAAPLEMLVGPCRVVGIADSPVVDVCHLLPFDLQAGDRLLLRTRNSDRQVLRNRFDDDFVALTADAASFLAARGVALVGVDSLSVGRLSDGLETHRILLEAGTWIIEGLDLADVTPGSYRLLCLPLKVQGADGAPARVLLESMSEDV
jgi:arylformamidase